jgi:two-component system NtrC family response regulator
MITGAPEMLKVARTIERVANTGVSVMLLGASGTGKELLARGLHDASRRCGGGFVAINCAAIPENLLEAELFGYEKGAFTGAVKTTEGKIELAHGGTLFLDEVGDIPLPLQVKLLRFLQERVIERIGGRRPIAVDTRIVCATHQDLPEMIKAGRFREDLWYRLAEIVVRIPSLAERHGDSVLLAKHFLHRFAREMNPQVKASPPPPSPRSTPGHGPAMSVSSRTG